MKKLLSIPILILLLLPVVTAILHGEPTAERIIAYDRGYRYNVGGWIYLHIESKPYERGFQHGYLLADEIVDMMERWSKVVHNMRVIGLITGSPDSQKYEKSSEKWWDFCKTRITKIYWKDYPQEYREEIKGIADGITARGKTLFGKKVTYEDILTLNEMYEFLSRFTHPCKSIHPFRSLLYLIRGLVCSTGEKLTLVPMSKNVVNHHCSGFIATGNATTHGQMIIAHSTWFGKYWFPYYIPQRWNIILDVLPDEGNRFIVATAPGLIWSDEDYYQNEKGIAFIETTVYQGLWRDRGLPLAIRARLAVQYGNSIDDVINYLVQNSDGIMNAVWLIGDANSGEIARLETGLFVYSVKRTFNGFYWSAVNAENFRVRSEQLRIQSFIMGRYLQLLHFFNNNQQYKYFTREYHPADRDLKFEELGKKYYGKIDTEVVKKILSTPPISEQSTECKITDSYLIKNNGLWIFWGCPDGRTLEVTKFKEELPEKAIKVEPTGWIKIFGLPDGRSQDILDPHSYYRNSLLESKVFWKKLVGNESNDISPKLALSGDHLYTTACGKLICLDASTGAIKWEREFEKHVTGIDVDNTTVTVGCDREIYTFTLDGTLLWKKTLNERISSVGLGDEIVAVGTCYGDIYIFERNSGDQIAYRSVSAGNDAYVAVYDNKIAVCSRGICLFLDDKGKILWNISADNFPFSIPSIYNSILYVGSWDSYLYALDITNGKIKWKFKTGWGIDAKPVEKDGVVYLSSMDGNLYALDRDTGKKLWYFSANAAIRSSPIIYGKYVFFGADDGRFYALNKTTGICEWFFAPKHTLDSDIYNYVTTPIASNPVAHGNKVFVGANGYVYALDAHTVEEQRARAKGIPYTAIWLFLILPAVLILLVLAIYLYKTRE